MYLKITNTLPKDNPYSIRKSYYSDEAELRYSEDQPRDELGRWTSTGDSSAGLTENENSGNINTENERVIIGMQSFANKNIPRMSDRELQKSIDSWNQRISEHKLKIKYPEKYCDNWERFDNRYQRGLIRHWNHEINTLNNDINAARKELKRRSENE